MADPTWTDEDWIKRRATMADQMWGVRPSGGKFSALEGLFSGLGSGIGNLDVRNSIDQNQSAMREAIKGAASQPNSRALSQHLINSGVPALGNQGLGIMANTYEKEADRKARSQEQMQMFEFQKRLAMDLKQAETKQMLETLKAAGLMPPENGPAQAPAGSGASAPATPGDATNPNTAFADELLADDGRPDLTPARKAGIALALGEKGKAADALMEKGGKITEGQGKDASFAERMLRAEAGLRGVVPTDKEGKFLKYDPTSSVYRFLPDWNVTNSAEWQQYSRNAREGIAAILRKDTGAAVSDTEWQWYFPMYYPQPGDSAQVVKDKQAARISVARGLRGSSGHAFDQMFPKFNEQLRAKLLQSGADLTPKAPAASQTPAAAGKYAQVRKNPKTGAMVGLNPDTNQWEPIQTDAAPADDRQYSGMPSPGDIGGRP